MSDVQAHAANCRMAKIAGWHSATIFLTDLGGTVTQHDGNFLAVDGFPFFDGNLLAVDGKSFFFLTVFLRR